MVTQWMAAMPEANASAPQPDFERRQRRLERLARRIAAARIVELAPVARTRAARTWLARWIGGTTAPVAGSGSLPTWMARVRNCMALVRSKPWSCRCRACRLVPGRRSQCQGLGQIGHQVLGVFDAAGQADHVVGNAEAPALLGRALEIAHHQRLLDQRFDAAQAGADPRNAARRRPRAAVGCQSASRTRNVTRPPKPRIVRRATS